MSELILFENFSELPIGSTVPPAGWTNQFGQFLVIPAPQNQVGSTHAAKVFGPLFTELPIPSTDMSLFFGFFFEGGNNAPGPLVALAAQDSISFEPVVVLQINVETDRSLSMNVGSKHIGNTADPTSKPSDFVPFYAANGTWYWAQINIQAQVNRDPDASISYFDLGLSIEGNVQFSGEFDPSNFDAGGDDPISASMHFLNFQSGIGFMYLREISAWTPHLSLGDWPYPLTPPLYVNGLLSQAVAEVTGPNQEIGARVSQGVIEYMNNFDTRNVRISQAVIEVLTAKGIGPKISGWTVKEV